MGLLILSILCTNIYAQEAALHYENNIVPLKTIFHEMGWNALRSFTYNGGLNYMAAGLGTWAFVDSGLDWKYNRWAYNHLGIAYGGLCALYTGFAMPAITPVAFYLFGRHFKNVKLQITAMALTQTLMLTLGIQSVFKMATGREKPGIVNTIGHTRNDGKEDYSGQFNWFNMNFMDGWPSGHTANAFSAAATIATIYDDNIWVQLGAYTYATFIGLGVSVNVHWASEVWAGALIGYAIGKVVGISFKKLLTGNVKKEGITPYVGVNSIGIKIRF
jgi:membrane-associated phospholipid phosphatase